MADFETDYLIIGAGAVGLAFADTLIDENPDCHITFIDKHAKPGGHWNDAYGFVALHQPSATYGVNSMTFPSEQIDTHGLNQGMHALASGTEVLAYLEKVMNLRLLPTGRVDYHRLSEYMGRNEDGTVRITRILSGEEITIKVRRKLVDATFYQASVPSTHKRKFKEFDDVSVVPPGDLPQLWKRADDLPEHYVILGAGKTAMDTAVWLIQAGVDPYNISWVRPRESWLANRKHIQPGEDFFELLMDWQLAHLKAATEAEDGDEWMALMAEDGNFLKIDAEAQPTMYHFAAISEGEIEILRLIENVIRKGRVDAIGPGKLVFPECEVDVPLGSLFIDCTATAVPFSVRDKQRHQFVDDTILLQPLHVPLVMHSAALSAFVEARFKDNETRNKFCTPGPLTDTPATYPFAFLVTMKNRGLWSQDPEISKWLMRSRLDPTGPLIAELIAKGSPKLGRLEEFRNALQEAMPHLQRLGLKAQAIHEAA